MTEYYEDDMANPEQEVVRPKAKKKGSSFAYCKWAAGDWEARFYYWTDAHRRECEQTINDMVNNPVWFKTKRKKVDKAAAVANNKAKGRGKRKAA